jgi:hypothetical protein
MNYRVASELGHVLAQHFQVAKVIRGEGQSSVGQSSGHEIVNGLMAEMTRIAQQVAGRGRDRASDVTTIAANRIGRSQGEVVPEPFPCSSTCPKPQSNVAVDRTIVGQHEPELVISRVSLLHSLPH